MLKSCFERFTCRYLDYLAPDVVILCGAAAYPFHDAVQRQLPQAKILRTLHYAHRKGKAIGDVEGKRLKNLLEIFKKGGPL